MATDSTIRRPAYEAGMAVTAEEYERIALHDPDVSWELHRGRLREKPGMSVGHNRATIRLARQLLPQLDESRFEVRIDNSRVRRAEVMYYMPDLFVARAEQSAAIPDLPGVLEVYVGPLPLVVEVWSPSTGDYDVEEKFPEYQRRGDEEIWRIHPYERTLRAWRRQPDGTYTETVHTGGTVQPMALPGVTVDLDELFR